jgi:hypothetical protein
MKRRMRVERGVLAALRNGNNKRIKYTPDSRDVIKFETRIENAK